MKTREKQKGKPKKSAVRRAIVAAVSACVIAAVGICNAVLPFRTLLPAFSLAKRAENEVRIHVLDVGQGDCAVVEMPDGKAVVIDGGDGSWEHNNHILRYLKGLGSPALTVVATHADLDHCGGLSSLFGAFEIEKLYLPALDASNEPYRTLLATAEEYGCGTERLSRYDVLEGGSAYFVCISPYSVDETDGNDSSAVLYFSYAGVNALFCADISEEREARLLREYELSEELGEHLFDSGDHAVRLEETDVVKVSHHGSDGSSSAAWLDLLSPQTALISCGAWNSYGHPSGGALERLQAAGADIFRTDELGDLMLTISPDGTYKTEYGYLK